LRLAANDLEQHLLWNSPRVTGSRREPGCRVEQDKGTTSFGKRGSKEHGKRATFGEPQDGRAFRARGIHDGSDVRHLVSRSGRRSSGTGSDMPVPRRSKNDQTAEGSQPPLLAGQLGDVPEGLDMVHPTLDHHDVQRALAQDLVGEMDLAVLRVLGGGETVHGAQAWQSRGAAFPDRTDWPLVDDVPASGIAAVEAAFHCVLDAVEPLSIEDARGDSRLPGWTRGHVLTHLARNADGNRNIVEGALANQERSQYPGGAEQRVSEIKAGAGRAPQVLLDDLKDSQRSLIATWGQLPPDGWQWPGVWLTAGRRPVAAGLRARRRELLVHLVDLDLGVHPDDLPADFRFEQVDWLRENRGPNTWPDANWC
jgi:uncharacterized protein (TIGR03083 family)